MAASTVRCRLGGLKSCESAAAAAAESARRGESAGEAGEPSPADSSPSTFESGLAPPCSFSSRLQRLRTDESERPGSEAAIWRHLKPCWRTPSRIIASSSVVHMVRPWSAFFSSSSSDTSGSDGGIQFLSIPHESSSSSSARRPSSDSPSPCLRCSLCHRFRTPSDVRPGSWAAIRPHCVPRRRKVARMTRSSSGRHSALRRETEGSSPRSSLKKAGDSGESSACFSLRCLLPPRSVCDGSGRTGEVEIRSSWCK
mmetsp:Transcript_16463/g.47467  ORF Transcript_16463/g.47467 Transcript_16463/m.47467 type:complete len:255 (+) Transcript_16463:1060-1824(+)